MSEEGPKTEFLALSARSCPIQTSEEIHFHFNMTRLEGLAVALIQEHSTIVNSTFFVVDKAPAYEYLKNVYESFIPVGEYTVVSMRRARWKMRCVMQPLMRICGWLLLMLFFMSTAWLFVHIARSFLSQ